MAADLPLHLLEDIFLRLDDAADIARASAACASFRRVVSDGRFLRRFRSLHRVPVLGLLLDDRHYETGLFCPAQAQSPAAAAAGLAKAADFTFSFLPDRSRWRVCDARDGRVLLTRCRGPHYTFEGLVVCDPLRRRHVQIPTIPGDLILSAMPMQDGNDDVVEAMMMTFDDPFLAPPPVADDEEGFRVMCTALSSESKAVVVALAFSSTSGQWRCVASCSNPTSCAWTNIPKIWSRQYVHGRFCWTHEAANEMLVFDTREMKFSIADLPSHLTLSPNETLPKMAVEARDGRLGLLLLSKHRRSVTVDLYSKPWQGIVQERPEEWQWQRGRSVRIPIPIRGFDLTMLDAVAEGYVVLRGIPEKKREAHYFTVDLKTKTLLVEKLCVLEYDSRVSFLYASFPPPLSPPIV